MGWPVGTYKPTDTVLVESVTDAVETVGLDRVYRRSAIGGGNAKKSRQARISTVEFAFGTDTVHAVDEYTSVDALERNAEVHAWLPSIWSANR